MTVTLLTDKGMGCLSICLWRWSEENPESVHNKNMWTRSFCQHLFWPTFLMIFSHTSHLIIKDSLHSGLFPAAFKSAMVKPLFKKTTLNPEILKNLQTSVKPLFSVQNPWESCFPQAVNVRQSVDQQSILISQLTVLAIALRQPFSRSSVTFSLLSMKTKSLSCLCFIYLLPLILLTTPFFCHILVTLLVNLTLFLLGSPSISDSTQTISVNGSKSLPAHSIMAFPTDLL